MYCLAMRTHVAHNMWKKLLDKVQGDMSDVSTGGSTCVGKKSKKSKAPKGAKLHVPCSIQGIFFVTDYISPFNMSATASFVVDTHVTTSTGTLSDLVTLAGNDEVISSNPRLIRLDAGGSARTGGILQVGSAGRECIVINEGGEVVDLAAAATSNVAGASGSVGWQPGQAYHYIWDSTNLLWAPVGQALS